MEVVGVTVVGAGVVVGISVVGFIVVGSNEVVVELGFVSPQLKSIALQRATNKIEFFFDDFIDKIISFLSIVFF